MGWIILFCSIYDITYIYRILNLNYCSVTQLWLISKMFLLVTNYLQICSFWNFVLYLHIELHPFEIYMVIKKLKVFDTLLVYTTNICFAVNYSNILQVYFLHFKILSRNALWDNEIFIKLFKFMFSIVMRLIIIAN